MAEYYRYVIIETFLHSGGASKHLVRARPIPGQGLAPSMRVECSSSMRDRHPIGTKFKVWARIKDTDQTPHLYTFWRWKYDVVNDEETKNFLQKKDWERK